MNLAKLSAIPANATEYNVDNLSPVRDAVGFRAWMDENYPEENIKVSLANLAYDDVNGWAGFLINPFGFKGAYLATLISVTTPDMYAKDQATKEANPWHKTDRLKKRTRTKVMGGNWRYVAAVNNARIKVMQENDGPIFLNGNVLPPVDVNNDGDFEVHQFEAHPRQWGQRVENAAIVTHKGNIYAEFRPLQWYENQFFVDGEEVSEESVDRFLKDNSKSQQKQAEHQGVDRDNMVHLRDYNINGIKVISFAGRKIWVY